MVGHFGHLEVQQLTLSCPTKAPGRRKLVGKLTVAAAPRICRRVSRLCTTYPSTSASFSACPASAVCEAKDAELSLGAAARRLCTHTRSSRSHAAVLRGPGLEAGGAAWCQGDLQSSAPNTCGTLRGRRDGSPTDRPKRTD